MWLQKMNECEVTLKKYYLLIAIIQLRKSSIVFKIELSTLECTLKRGKWNQNSRWLESRCTIITLTTTICLSAFIV